MRRVRYAVVVLAALAGMCAAVPAVAVADQAVTSPHARVFGMKLGEWQGLWWTHALELPAAESPLGGAGDPCFRTGRVLVSYVLDGSSCTVPDGTAIFWAAFTLECSTVEDSPFHGGPDLASLLACAADFNRRVHTVDVTIDGRPVPDVLQRFRAQTPLLAIELPADNLLGAAPGPARSAADGWAVMVKPLEVGVHELTFRVTGDFAGFGPDDQPGSMHVIVAPKD